MVNVTDTKGNPRKSDIVLFKSDKSASIFSGKSGANGKFTIQLPIGDKYTIIVANLGDSTRNRVA